MWITETGQQKSHHVEQLLVKKQIIIIIFFLLVLVPTECPAKQASIPPALNPLCN